MHTYMFIHIYFLVQNSTEFYSILRRPGYHYISVTMSTATIQIWISKYHSPLFSSVLPTEVATHRPLVKPKIIYKKKKTKKFI